MKKQGTSKTFTGFVSVKGNKDLYELCEISLVNEEVVLAQLEPLELEEVE